MDNFDGRGKSKNKNKLRNLPQYKNKTDEELDELLARKEERSHISSKPFEERIEEKMAMFEQDYDLSDMKINDREILRGLIQSIISLEDYEQEMFKVRSGGITPENILLVDKMGAKMSDLRSDISKYQNDLAITRKHRKSDQETSVVAYIDGLKEKARKFYQSKMSYIMCPKCNTLLCTSWFLYPDSNNKIMLVCLQKDKDGNECNTRVVITSKELYQNKNTNKKEILPDSVL